MRKPIRDFQLIVKDEVHAGIGCRQVTVDSPSGQEIRYLGDILDLLGDSNLPFVIVLTKVDKINQTGKAKNLGLTNLDIHGYRWFDK